MLQLPDDLKKFYRHRHFETIDSTNKAAMELARNGDSGNVWVTADRQSAGRARRGRDWISSPGNLYSSLLLISDGIPANQGHLPFIISLALRDAILHMAPSLNNRLQLKWPNDVLLDGSKLSGILIEGESMSEHRYGLVIGVGINCQHHPVDTDWQAINLTSALGEVVLPSWMFAHLSSALDRRLSTWRAGEGFDGIRSLWLANAAGIGEKITVRLADRELQGCFITVDEGGLLVLRLPDGREMKVSAGDVFFSES